ncbi:MAG: hypothetical protein WCG08_07065 [Paludibacter sp.]
MRKLTSLKIFIILISILSLSANLQADTYTHTISASTWTALGDQTLTGVTWTAAATWKTGTSFFGYDTNNTPSKGQQFGSSTNPATALTLTTNGILGTITDIKVTTSGASSIAGTVGITVGGTAFTTNAATTATLTSTSAVYDFTGSGVGSIVINWSQTSSKAIYLKAIEITYSSCTASNVAFSSPSTSKIIGDVNFTQTPTTLSTGVITYSSSATSVATVNTNSGEVTIAGIGSTTITATQATVNPYCGSTAAYTLNVTAAPTLTVTDVTAPVLVSTDGSQVSQTINVSAVNLTNDLGLALTGPNANLFTLSQYSVTQTAGSVPNTAITITYKPIIGTNHSATLTMASTGAFDLSRSIIGQNNGPTTVIPVLSLLNVTVYNGKINFTANEGESLDIYSSVGQRLLHKLTNDGINTISAPANGVLIVKVGNRVGKVIL